MHDIRIWHMKMIIYNRGKSVVHFRHNLLVFVRDSCEKMESYWVKCIGLILHIKSGRSFTAVNGLLIGLY